MSSSSVPAPTAADRATQARIRAEPTQEQVRSLHWAFVLFALIGATDTLSTLVLLCQGLMEEYNPLMRWVLAQSGMGVFVGVKLLLIVVPLWILNRVKYGHFAFVRSMTWVANVGYIVLYAILFWQANGVV